MSDLKNAKLQFMRVYTVRVKASCPDQQGAEDAVVEKITAALTTLDSKIDNLVSETIEPLGVEAICKVN